MPTGSVVDRNRRIRAADVNPDYTMRPEPKDTVAVVRQLYAAGSKGDELTKAHPRDIGERGVCYPDTATVPKGCVDSYRQHVW